MKKTGLLLGIALGASLILCVSFDRNVQWLENYLGDMYFDGKVIIGDGTENIGHHRLRLTVGEIGDDESQQVANLFQLDGRGMADMCFDMEFDPTGLVFRQELGFGSDEFDWMYFHESNRVGLGTRTPSERLEVVGKIKSSGPNSAFILYSPDGTEWEITVDNDGYLSADQITVQNALPELEEDIDVYPNPTTGEVRIDLNNLSDELLVLEIYDMSGRMVFMNRCASELQTVNLNEYSGGTYIAKVKSESGELLLTKKIIKQ